MATKKVTLRSLSKKEVELLWKDFKAGEDRHDALLKSFETKDGPGILFTHQEEWVKAWNQREIYRDARHLLMYYVTQPGVFDKKT